MFRICALRVSRDNGKEGDKICRLMARSGRLPSGFDYTLIKIIINTKLIRNRKFNIIN